MIKPVNFELRHFLSSDPNVTPLQYWNILAAEALEGSDLIDMLILLRFATTYEVQTALAEHYGMPFTWLKVDMTPPELKEIAEKHHVLIRRGQTLTVYVPLNQEVDDALLQVDIPNYQISIQYIAACNYRLLKSGLPPTLLTMRTAAFRPLLVFKRLVLECFLLGGTNLHFESYYRNKQPQDSIRYRVNRMFENSSFTWDRDMYDRVFQEVIGKLTPASVADIDSNIGISTSVRDVFKDGACELRITGHKVDAGHYFDVAIQDISTSAKHIDELGFPAADVSLIRQIAQHRTGLTLVTGQMRSGKNTTIYAMLNELPLDELQVMEYSYPIENHMSFPQYNYQGDINLLRELLRMSKKEDLDVAVLNEIPNAEVAFAVRDLVNSAIGVITTTHIDRVWHLPNKLREFFGNDYKTIVSQLNAVINQRMFRRWECQGMQKRTLVKEQGEFEMFCWKAGVRTYFVPSDASAVKYALQPLTEILVITDAMKTSMLNFDEIWRAEQMLKLAIEESHGTLENKCAEYVNAGIMSLEEMRKLR